MCSIVIFIWLSISMSMKQQGIVLKSGMMKFLKTEWNRYFNSFLWRACHWIFQVFSSSCIAASNLYFSINIVFLTCDVIFYGENYFVMFLLCVNKYLSCFILNKKNRPLLFLLSTRHGLFYLFIYLFLSKKFNLCPVVFKKYCLYILLDHLTI